MLVATILLYIYIIIYNNILLYDSAYPRRDAKNIPDDDDGDDDDVCYRHI